MIDEIRQDAAQRMKKSIAALKDEFAKVRTGRAHTSLLDHVTVSYYGSDVPLNQVANVSVADSRTLTITPWEKNMVPLVEKAILTSNLGVNPSTAGNVIRVILPPLTEERRRDMTKIVRAEAENARIAIRNIRRDAIASVKELQKEKEISEDDERRAEEKIQKLTDQNVQEVDAVLAAKEAELMEI